MLPAANPVGAAVAKPSQPVTAQTAARAAQPQAPETARTSAGETGAANVRTETPTAVQAPEQTAVAPRLRDQEKAETSERAPGKDAPAGPPPSFEESPLERQARVAFDPPAKDDVEPKADNAPPAKAEAEADTSEQRELSIDPPPTPTERAEVSFAETQSLAEPKGPATVDVAR